MKTLMDHVQEFAFDTANEMLKRFTPEQANELRTEIESSYHVSDTISALEAAVSDVLAIFLYALRREIWKGEDQHDD